MEFGRDYDDSPEEVEEPDIEPIGEETEVPDASEEPDIEPIGEETEVPDASEEPDIEHIGELAEELEPIGDKSELVDAPEDAKNYMDYLHSDELGDEGESLPLSKESLDDYFKEEKSDLKEVKNEKDLTDEEPRSDSEIPTDKKNPYENDLTPEEKNQDSEPPVEKENPQNDLITMFQENPLLKGWFESQTDEFQRAVRESADNLNIIKYGYGYWVPLEIIQQGSLSALLRKTGTFKDFNIKNPGLGPYIEFIRVELQLKQGNFLKILGKNSGYFKIIKNEWGVNIQRFLHLSEHPFIQEKLTKKEIEGYEKMINKILISKDSVISKGGVRIKLNFHPDNLQKIKLGSRDYVILPTGKWETKRERNIISQWIEKFRKDHNGRSPTKRIIRREFPGFLNHLSRYGIKFNDFLKSMELPLNLELKYDWKNYESWEMAKTWASLKYIFGERKSPTKREILDTFGGLYNHLKKFGVPTEDGHIPIYKHNELLKFWDLPPNLEHKYNWNDHKNWDLVKNWIQNFHTVTHIFDLGREGRSPTMKEVVEQFGQGLWDHSRKFGIPNKERHIQIHKYNDLLKSLELPPTLKKIYDWTNPNIWTQLKQWIRNFYATTHIFDNDGRSPTLNDAERRFGQGFYKHLRKYGISEVETKIFSYNDLLKSINLPITDIKQNKKEGDQFERVGKEYLDFLYQDIIKGYKIFHPVLKNYNKKWVVPDGITHNFDKIPLKKNQSAIFLTKEQKLDKLIDFKRSFGAMTKKDWKIYPKLTKNIDIILLKGNNRTYQVKNCQIRFISKRKFIQSLREKITPSTKEQIEILIGKIQAIDRGLYDKIYKDDEQKTLSDY